MEGHYVSPAAALREQGIHTINHNGMFRLRSTFKIKIENLLASICEN